MQNGGDEIMIGSINRAVFAMQCVLFGIGLYRHDSFLLVAAAAGALVCGYSILDQRRRKIEYQSIRKTLQLGNNTIIMTEDVSVEEMIQAYKEQLSKQYTASVNDQSIRIKVLQNQINPHFLYNTLESIRSLAVIGDAEVMPQIADMTEALARYFRYNISNVNDFVTINEELENIKQYMAIQKFRFSNRFDLQILFETGSEDIGKYMVPKLVLQPIVENSIFHGLENKTEGGIILIRFSESEKKLYIHIEDNGLGMPEAELLKLQERIQQKEIKADSSESAHNGVALWQINKQIKLVFGEEYGLQIYSTHFAGTTVELTLPKMVEQRKV